MKKTDLHNMRFTHRAKRALCLLLALLTLAGDVALPKANAGEDYIHDEKMYIWHKVTKMADLPKKKEWVPIILGFRSENEGDDGSYFISDPGYVAYDPEDSDYDDVDEFGVFTDADLYTDSYWEEMTAPTCYASDWYDAYYYAPSQYPYIGAVETFCTRGDVLPSTWAIYPHEETDDEGRGFATYAIGRNIDYSKKTEPRNGQVLVKEDTSSEDYADFYTWGQPPFPAWGGENGKMTIDDYGGVKWTIITSDLKGKDADDFTEGLSKNCVRFRYLVSSGGDVSLHHWRDRVFTCGGADYDCSDNWFFLWWGEEITLPTYSDVTYETGIIHNIEGEVLIEEGATLTVEPGAVLSISGHLYNNGTIRNYGTIIVQDGGSISTLRPQTEASRSAYLDKYTTDYMARGYEYIALLVKQYGYDKAWRMVRSDNEKQSSEASKLAYWCVFSEDCGRLCCSGGSYTNRQGQKMNAEGNLLVLGGGRIYFSEGADLFRVESGATVELGGMIVCPNAFQLSNSDFYIRRGGVLYSQYSRWYDYKRPDEMQTKEEAIKDHLAGKAPFVKMPDLSPTPLYVSGRYQFINDGRFINAGKAIREADVSNRTFRDITTVEGSGTYTAMSPVTGGTWEQPVGSGGVEKIVYHEDGSNQIQYDDGTIVTVNADGSSVEECYTQYKDASIYRDASGWYVAPPDSDQTRFAPSYWKYHNGVSGMHLQFSYARESTGASTKDNGEYIFWDDKLICEGYYDPKSDVFYTYYYKDKDGFKAGQATVERRNGTIDVYTYRDVAKSKIGEKTTDKKIGTCERIVNAIGEVTTVTTEYNKSYRLNTGSSVKTVQCSEETTAYKDRTEKQLVLNTDKSAGEQKSLLMSVAYTAGKFAGNEITYTVADAGGADLGGYYYMTQAPDLFNANKDYQTLWRVNNGKDVFVCAGKWNATGNKYDYIVFARSVSGYDPARDNYYIANKSWLKVKEIGGTKPAMPNPESFLKGWPY